MLATQQQRVGLVRLAATGLVSYPFLITAGEMPWDIGLVLAACITAAVGGLSAIELAGSRRRETAWRRAVGTWLGVGPGLLFVWLQARYTVEFIRTGSLDAALAELQLALGAVEPIAAVFVAVLALPYAALVGARLRGHSFLRQLGIAAGVALASALLAGWPLYLLDEARPGSEVGVLGPVLLTIVVAIELLLIATGATVALWVVDRLAERLGRERPEEP